MAGKKHDWNALDHYLSIHDKVIMDFASNWVQIPSYIKNSEVQTDSYIFIGFEKATIRTNKGTIVRVDISKDVEVRNIGRKKTAKTDSYTYSASHPRSAHYPKGQELIRYCSPHDDLDRKNVAPHHPHHHKHDYEKNEIFYPLDDKSIPHVSDFLEEVIQRF